MHENKNEFKEEMEKIIGYVEFKYQNLLYNLDYNLEVFSINEDYGLDYVKFYQIFSRAIHAYYKSEDEFNSLITNNKINLANDFNFTRLFDDDDNEIKFWRLIKHSIELDKSEFVNLLIQKSGIKLSKMPFYIIRDLYMEVKIVFC